MKLSLVTYPDQRLRVPTKPVKYFDSGLRDRAKAMSEIMFREQGIGIAAQQCGLDISIILCLDTESGRLHVLCNPKLEFAQGCDLDSEGCLSFPGIFKEVPRPTRVVVKYQDIGGNRKTLTAQGLLARCVLHEMEHLRGILLSDPEDKKVVTPLIV